MRRLVRFEASTNVECLGESAVSPAACSLLASSHGMSTFHRPWEPVPHRTTA